MNIYFLGKKKKQILEINFILTKFECFFLFVKMELFIWFFVFKKKA